MTPKTRVLDVAALLLALAFRSIIFSIHILSWFRHLALAFFTDAEA